MDKHLQVHKEVKILSLTWVSGKYSDHPEGQDLSGKLYYTLKVTSSVGAFFGILALKYRPRPQVFLDKVVRVGHFVVPTVAAGLVFTPVVFCATNLRQKDDQWNYALGGAAAGLILGPITRIPVLSTYGVVILGLSAYIKKCLDLNGIQIAPPTKNVQFSSYALHHLDGSLMKDSRRGNWTREPAPEK